MFGAQKPLLVVVAVGAATWWAHALWAQVPAVPTTTLVGDDFNDVETGAAGWQGINSDYGHEDHSYQPPEEDSGSGGYIRVSEEQGDRRSMYLAAPAKYMGDKRAAFNGILRFDIRQPWSNDFYTTADVIVASGDASLLWYFPRIPGPDWMTVQIPLNGRGGWLVEIDGESRPATDRDVVRVLANIERIWIRAEYTGHRHDHSDLDNFAFIALSPHATVTAESYVAIRIEGQVGASYRVEYRPADEPAQPWKTLTEIELPESPYLFQDETAENGRSRVYRAVLLAKPEIPVATQPAGSVP